MAGRHTERSKSRCDSVSPIPKGKLAHHIYLRARYFASRGIKTAEQGQDGAPAERVMSPRLGPCFKRIHRRVVSESRVSNISFLPGCPEGASFEKHNGTCIECLRWSGIIS